MTPTPRSKTAVFGSSHRRVSNFTEELDKKVNRIKIGVPCEFPEHNSSMARVSSVIAKHAFYAMYTSSRVLNVASLRKNRGQRRALAGENKFGDIWMLAEGECAEQEQKFFNRHYHCYDWLNFPTNVELADARANTQKNKQPFPMEDDFYDLNE